MKLHRIAFFAGLAALSACLFAVRASAQQEETPPAEPPAPSESEPPISREKTLLLNEALRAFALPNVEDIERARALLTQLLQIDPENTAGQYYLGLIYLSDGLALSGSDKPAAVAAFAKAREFLESVIRSADKSLIPVGAALELGIAQLASGGGDDAADQKNTADAARRALISYVESDEGKNDRFGHFFLAVAYYRLWKADRSTEPIRLGREALDKCAALSASDTSAAADDVFATQILYYDALFSLAQDRKPEAQGKLEQVVERAPGSRFGSSAETILKELAEQQATSGTGAINFDTPIGKIEFEGSVAMGLFYDSNVILLGKDTALPRGIVQKYDWRYGVEAGFDLTRMFSERDGVLGKSLLIGAGATTGHFWQPSIGEFDINSYSGRVYANWEVIQDLFLGVQYDYSYTMLGHDPFISSNRVTPVITKRWNRTGPRGREEVARTDIYYSFDNREYFDTVRDRRLNRDGNYHTIGFTQNFNLVRAGEIWKDYYAATDGGSRKDFFDSERWLALQVGYYHRNESTDGDEFDLAGNSIWAGVQVPLPYRLTFDVRTEFTWDDYWQRSLFDFEGKQRNDFLQRYDFGLTRTFVDRGEYEKMPTLQVRLRGGIELIFADSNIWDRLGQDVYEYDRVIYGLKLLISF